MSHIASPYGLRGPAIPLSIRRDNIKDMATLAALSKQPKVQPALHLLHVGYEHDGLTLDLYGEHDKFDDVYIVQDACLTETTVSLEPLLPQSVLTDMSNWCDRHLGNVDKRESEGREIMDDAMCDLRSALK